MTGAPDPVVGWRGSDVAHWSLCAAAIVAVHAGAIAYIVTREPASPAGHPAATVLEMLPEVAAAPSEPTELPSGPDMQKMEEVPDKLAAKPDDEETTTEVVKPAEPEPEAPPAPLAPKPDVALAPPREPEPPVATKPLEKKPIETPKRPEPKKKPPQKFVPATAAPPPSPQAPRQARAVSGVSSPTPSSAQPAWDDMVRDRLQRGLRAPPGGLRGLATVRFTVSGSGQLLSAGLVSSAGDSQLDQEAVAVVRRSAPFPPPPSGQVTRTIPMRFNTR
jgi:protein TonB